MAIRYCDYILEYVYFGSLDEQTMKKFFPIEFNKMIDITNELFSEYYVKKGGLSIKNSLSRLNKLRNSEMHFLIDGNTQSYNLTDSNCLILHIGML